jgi:hypothetical protein
MTKVRYALKHNRKGEKLDKASVALIQIVAYQGRLRKHFGTNIRVTQDQWNEKHGEVVKHPNATKLNLAIRKQIEEFEKYELSIINSGREFTLSDFDEKALYEKRLRTTSFIDYAREEIDARNDLRESTRKQHHVMVRQLEACGQIKTFTDLTRRNIELFENWLIKNGAVRSTVQGYHKRLKIYIHRAINSG